MRSTALLLTLLCAGAAFAQQTPEKPSKPEVDVSAVIRRGDLVQAVGDGYKWGVEEAIGEALSPPPDDAHRWYITVVTTDGCRYCETLKRDFQREPLSAWVSNPEFPDSVWAHYQVVRYEDPSQRHKFDKIGGIQQVPTIIIQPPRSGQFGPNSNLVGKIVGYDGNANKLDEQIRTVVRRYIQKMHDQGLIRQADARTYTQPPSREIPQHNAVVSTPAVEPGVAYAQEQQQNPIGQRSPPYDVGPRTMDPRTPVGPFVEVPPEEPVIPGMPSLMPAMSDEMKMLVVLLLGAAAVIGYQRYQNWKKEREEEEAEQERLEEEEREARRKEREEERQASARAQEMQMAILQKLVQSPTTSNGPSVPSVTPSAPSVPQPAPQAKPSGTV